MTETEVMAEALRSMEVLPAKIAESSTETRKALIGIIKSLRPHIEKAGIEFGEPARNRWQYTEWCGDCTTRRLIIGSFRGKWNIYLEYTHASPDGWDDPFCEEGKVYEGGETPIYELRRDLLDYVVEVLPAFLVSYAEELKRRHQKYADLRDRARMIATILE